MSFILDAIKKSESERQKNRQPDVHSLQNAGGYRTERSRKLGRVASFIVSVSLIAGISLWFWPKIEEQFAAQRHLAKEDTDSSYGRNAPPVNNIPERDVQAARVVTAPAPDSLRGNRGTSQANYQPNSDTTNYAANHTANNTDSHTTSRAGQDYTTTVPAITDADAELPPMHLIKEFWELPADYQSTVPDMEYSFHVFSKDPARRTIIINGRTIKEGQMVASGLKLRVITETGVIFHYRDRFFHVDVVEKW